MEKLDIRLIQDEDKEWLRDVFIKQWRSVYLVSRGKKHDMVNLPGFIALLHEKPVGVITYLIDHHSCEIVSLDSFHEGKGIGSQLVEAVKKIAEESHCKRLWLITTNDNTDALRFYQKRGFHFVAVYPNALDESRKLKPEIPLIGHNGIPLCDELELEIRLSNQSA